MFLCLSEMVLNAAMVEMSQLPQAAWALWQLRASAVALQVFVCNTANLWQFNLIPDLLIISAAKTPNYFGSK